MCGCGKKNSSPSNLRGITKGLTSDLRKSRQLPASTLRQFSAQREVSDATRLTQQENIKKIRQRSIREKFGHA
jgi:hypothetical protein